jgi:tetratricopeptide (TPR) repeat protein
MARRARRDAVRKKLNQKLNQNRQENAQTEPINQPPRLCYASFVHRLRLHQILRPLCALGLLVAVAASAQQAPTGQKVIQDPAEYNAYAAAVNTADATSRAEALEAFIQQYPKSVVLIDALEQEMAAWQTAGDSKQVMKVAKRLLAADSGNIRALGIVVALDRVSAAQGDNAALNEMCVEASGGMLEVPMWRQPANMSQGDYVTLSKLLNDIFVGAEGYCAVQQKNYSQAREWLARAYGMDPTNVQDTYQLAVADLESTPLDAGGFWYCARAIHLAQSAAIPQDTSSMVAYCKAQYTKYHGADDGWDALVTNAAAEDAPPPDFAAQIKPAAAQAAPQK